MLKIEAQLKVLAAPIPAEYQQVNNFTKKPFFPIHIWKYALRRRAPHAQITCVTQLSGIYCTTDVTITIPCEDGVLIRSANGFEVFDTEKQMRGNPATNSYAQAFKLACQQFGLGKASKPEADEGDE